MRTIEQNVQATGARRARSLGHRRSHLSSHLGSHLIGRVTLLSGAVCALVLGASSAAACRLDHSRIAALSRNEPSRIYATSVTAEYTSFDFGAAEGAYTRWMSRVDLFVGPRTTVSAEISMIDLRPSTEVVGRRSTTGFGNPLVSAQHVSSLWRGGSLSAGVQTELPAGTRSQGIAGDHLEVMPHVGLAHTGRNAALQVDLGYRFGPRDSAHDDQTETHRSPGNASLHSRHEARHGTPRTETPLLVDPHAAREWVARIALSTYRRDRSFAATAFLDGTFVEGGRRFDAALGTALDDDVVAGAEVSIEWGAVSFAPSLSIPLSDESRYRTRVQLRTEARF